MSPSADWKNHELGNEEEIRDSYQFWLHSYMMSTVNSQQLTVNSQQLTVNSQQSTVNLLFRY
ncbi:MULTISPECIES: hypothetical protein [unclassified Microcoleus]|uniref:hypothetical protein n=1 Tax=unclassified Microcoleus TaxID=2642155 RepID=UPI002FD40BA9